MWRIDGEEYVFFSPPLNSNVGNEEKMEKDGKKTSKHLVPRYPGIFSLKNTLTLWKHGSSYH